MTRKPFIGISLDWEAKGTFSTEPYYALRQNYCDAVEQAGGIPIAIPYCPNLINDYLNLVDALIVPGGDFAFPNEWYADQTKTSPFAGSPRLAFDVALMRLALQREKPMLTICAGMQMLACLNGSKLTGKIDPSDIVHKGLPRDHYAHTVEIVSESLLSHIVKTNHLEVNSVHCEALVSVGTNVKINARSSDGVIEGIEILDHPFALGVQWHPEFFIASANPHRMLFEALIQQTLKNT